MNTIRAKKSYGQNFLEDEGVLESIATFFPIDGKNILEVGPGQGALTDYLLRHTLKGLHLVELDRDMIRIIEGKIKNGELQTEGIHFQIFHEDILKFESKFGELPYYVIANIPYYITSPILFYFGYTINHKPDKMIIMMQEEVAERILDGVKSGKGKIKNSVLALAMGKKFKVSKICAVSREAFYPKPKVDSTVLAFERHTDFDTTNDTQFLEFIKKCFKEPRKLLVKNLVLGGFEKEKILQGIESIGYQELVRAEEICLEKIIKLFEFLQK